MIQLRVQENKVAIIGNIKDLNWSMIRGEEMFIATVSGKQIKDANFLLETYEQDQDEQWHEGYSEWKKKREE